MYLIHLLEVGPAGQEEGEAGSEAGSERAVIVEGEMKVPPLL